MRGGTVDRLDFTYTGQYNERLEDGVVEFLTSGILKFKKEAAIDAFLVGGGSSGSSGRTVQYNANTNGAGGGGGGYTKTLLNIIPRAGQEYPVIIGSGGAEQTTNLSVGNAGGTTSAFGSSVGGGEVASAREHGSNGGSGGGQGGTQTASTRNGKAGGVAGGNGGYYSNTSNGGIGQGTTTREFGEPTGKLYAGGGVAVLPSMEAPLSLLEQEATVGAVKVQDIMTMLLLEPPIPAAEVEVEQEILPPLV